MSQTSRLFTDQMAGLTCRLTQEFPKTMSKLDTGHTSDVSHVDGSEKKYIHHPKDVDQESDEVRDLVSVLSRNPSGL